MGPQQPLGARFRGLFAAVQPPALPCPQNRLGLGAVFPRYLFVAADPDTPGRRSINSAPGVVSVVSFGERLATISNAIIQAIQAREDAAGHVKLVEPNTLKPGDQVCLHSGAMAEHIGMFERRGDADRVVILLNLLGRSVRVKVPANSIARVL